MRRLVAEAMNPPRPPRPSFSAFPTEPSFSELSLFEKTMDLVSRPVYASASFADAMLKGQNPFAEAIKGFAGARRTTYGDVLGAAGMQPGLARSVIGLGLDVLGDPLTYTGIGAVGKAGTMTVKGIPRAMTALGMATKRAAVDAATVQARRVLSQGAELVSRPIWKDGRIVGQYSGPRLTASRLEGLRKGLPTEVRVGTEKLAPDAFRSGPEGAAALGARFGRDRTARMMGFETRPGALKNAPALTPRAQTAIRRNLEPQFKPKIEHGLLPSGKALQAPKAITFMGQPIPGTQKALARLREARPVGRVLDAAEKLPGVGKVVAPVREFAAKGRDAARAIFSAKTGDAEFDYFQTLTRDRLHRMNVDTQKFWVEAYREAEDIIGTDPVKRKKMREEFLKAIEGVEQDFIKLEPNAFEGAMRKRVEQFKRDIDVLSAKKAPFDAKEAIARAKLAEAEADKAKIPAKVAQSLEGVQRELKTEAVGSALKEAEDDLLVTTQTDALAKLEASEHGSFWITDEYRAKTGSDMAARLRDAGLPSKYFAKGKSGVNSIDVVAADLGYESAQDFMDDLERSLLKRREKREAVARLKGTKKELKAAGTPQPIPKAPERPADTVRGYQGSPHIVDKYDSAFIGTGQGAASYGHGHYFGGAKATGKAYQKQLGDVVAHTEDLKDYFKPGNIVPSYGGGHDRVVAFHETGHPWGGGWFVEVQAVEKKGDKWADVLGRGKRMHSTVPNPTNFKSVTGREMGKLYHVDIAETSKFLDLNKTLAEQTPHVQGVLKKLGATEKQTGGEIYDNLSKQLGSQRAASEKLKSVGIPGSKYLDAGSRGTAAESHNYVVFDDRVITKVADEAVEGMPIKVPAEDIPTHLPPQSVSDIHVPEEHMAAAENRYFTQQTEKLTKDAERRVADLTKAVNQATNSKRRGILQTQLDEAKAQLAGAEKRLAELPPQEVRYRKRVPYKPADPRIEEWAEKFRQRMAMIYSQEKRVNPLLRERQNYLPHIMRDEVRSMLVNVIKQDPRRILKSSEFSTVTAHAMARSNDKTVLELSLQKLIESGDVDTSKVREYFKSIGKPMSAVDELIFETDPVKAGMGRELAHNRAVVAGQFTDDILNSATFVKARVNAEDLLKLRQWRGEARGEVLKGKPPSIPLIQKILDEHPDHAIFIPSSDYARTYLTKEAQDQVRESTTDKNSFVALLKELLDDDLEKLPGAMARAQAEGKPIQAYVIPREIADHLSRAHKLMLDDKRVGDFLKVYDKWQGWWKAFSTVVRPAFHVRNAVSNLWQNFLAGVSNPKAYYLAGAVQNEAMRKGLAKIGQYSAQEIYDMALELGVLKTGFVGGDIGEFLEQSVRPSKNILSTRGPWARKMGEVGVSIEDNARLANFIDGLMKGMDPASASMRVKKYLFDYADLSEVEKAVFKRLIPFYTFTRKSIPLAVETLLTQPGKASILGKARMEAEKNVESLDREYVADYINQAFGIPIRKNDKGEYEYFLLKGYIPTVDIAKLDAQEILGMLSPFVKAPIEQALNTDFYRMKPISRFPTELVQFMGLPMPVRLAHLMRNLVLMSQLDREIFREGSSIGKGLASELSFRVQTQNPVDQMRRYVLSSQVEMGEIKRLRDEAVKNGENYKAAQYDARLSLLTARRDEAKAKTLKLDPDAFKFRKPAQPQKVEMPDFNRIRERLRREASIDGIMRKQRQAK